MDKEVLTVKQVAEFFQMDERTIYKLAKQGDIPSFKVSNQWRFLKKDIESWVEKKKSEVMGKAEKPLRE
ncbi:MAG TPA: helix-turn-helix domain-containing protein [Syntrophorhabdaceae bacterium]|nr:helix-turn-helix domain-containing protein [Syntrophorhabdaceae bacterium]